MDKITSALRIMYSRNIVPSPQNATLPIEVVQLQVCSFNNMNSTNIIPSPQQAILPIELVRLPARLDFNKNT
jgi:hypothetical protein